MLNNRKGVAMLIVIGLVFMLLILGGAALVISTGHFGTSYHQIKRVQAYYAAEAAMQHALWGCRTGAPGYTNLESITPDNPRTPPDSPITVTYPNYSFGVDIKIYALNDLPLDDPLTPEFEVPTPPDTYPILVEVQY